MAHASPSPFRKGLLALSAAAALVLPGCAATGLGGPSAAQLVGQPLTPQERQQGAEAHPQLLAQFGGAYDGPQGAYVERVTRRVATQSGLSTTGDDFVVTLLNTPVHNAFAIPGGYVYVTRNLLALMNDEAELAGVMGHEVGHVAARHGQRRQQQAQRNQIIGVLGQIASTMILGNSAAGQLGQQIFGTGSQLLTLSYSRGQEREADDLGVRYLSGAAYDPMAVSTMLSSLAAQGSLDARIAGREARSVPEWASTHPEPGQRVERAARVATNYAGDARGRYAFLNAIDGMLYGDDREQGIIEGNQFLHPVLRLQFAVPQGFTMQNGTRAVTITGQGGQAQFTSAGNFNGDLPAYVRSVFGALSNGQTQVNPGQISSQQINGLDTASASARVNNGRQTIDVTVVAYRFDSDTAFHFIGLTPSGGGAALAPLYNSLRRMTASEAAAVRERVIDVVTVQRGDTIDSLSRRMAYDQFQSERFQVLNRIRSDADLVAGERVKLIVFR